MSSGISRLEALAQTPEGEVREWMHPQVVTISPECSLGELADTLSQHHISGVPVVDDQNRVLGVVSQSDIARHLARVKSETPRHSVGFYEGLCIHSHDADPTVSNLLAYGQVKDILTPHTYSVRPEATVKEIVSLMLRHRVHRLPVISDGTLVGVVTTMDVLRLFQSVLAE